MMELDISEKLEQLSAERKQQGGTVPFSCQYPLLRPSSVKGRL